MSAQLSAAATPRPLALLDEALAWTGDCLALVGDHALDRPTPCSEWDLGRLLAHMNDSLTALLEAAGLGGVGLGGVGLDGAGLDGAGLGRVGAAETARAAHPTDLVDVLLARACAAREAWRSRATSAPVRVGELWLGRDTVLVVGALEVAVHGWDVARSVGAWRALPDSLAVPLYDVALNVVSGPDRGRRFAAPVEVPATAAPGVRLLGHLGRADR